MRELFISFFLIIICLDVRSQYSNYVLGDSYIHNFEETIHSSKNIHTSFRPLVNLHPLYNQADSLKNSNSWLYKKIFLEDLVILNGENYRVTASPIIDFSIGTELVDNQNTFKNTRGYILEGNLGKHIRFFSSLTENQATFPNYLHNYIVNNNIVPGQGYARDFKHRGFDYSMSSGNITYKVNDMFILQFGHGKHFIGDGYRSLLLSDNTFNYPYLRIQTKFWKIEYTNLYTEFQDIRYFENNGLSNTDQIGYPKKYMSAHYLSFNANEKLNIALFESVIWRMNHAPGSSGFDINYLNPIVIFRPIEFSLNSPDNVLIGINTKYKIQNKSFIYAQLILDEFSLNDLRENNGFWANKYGYQLGYKTFHLLGISNLSAQTEFNLVRPYTYAHHNPQQNYAHYNQPLAHPLGANFSELLFISRYKKGKWELSARLILAKYGGSFTNDSISYGNDVYQSTGQFQEPNGFIYGGRPDDFNINLYQGNKSFINTRILDLAYIINPKTNLKVNLQIVQRDFKDKESNQKTNFFSFGLVSDLFNHYYDF